MNLCTSGNASANGEPFVDVRTYRLGVTPTSWTGAVLACSQRGLAWPFYEEDDGGQAFRALDGGRVPER